MRYVRAVLPAVAGVLCLVCAACDRAPGYPRPEAEIARPDQVLDFHALYSQNCSGCHGANGRGGAALPLNNPAYLAIAGADNLRRVTADGINGTLMPAFAQSAGGMLTDQQVNAVVQGMLNEWSRPAEFAKVSLPPYAANATPDLAAGQSTFVAACARCHGSDGLGIKPGTHAPSEKGATTFSIVDPTYLALISNQGMRSIVMAGHPDPQTPDWRSYAPGGTNPLSPQQITNVVAWIVSHRSPDSAKAAGDLHAATQRTQSTNAPRKESK